MLYVLEDIGGRPYQEDRHSVKLNLADGYDYAAVFDGHGGHQVSEFLKFHLKDYVKKHLSAGASPKKALKLAFEEAHEDIPIDASYMTGSAAIAMLRKGQQIWVANAGDSRGILSGARRSIALSIDHKPHREDEHQRIRQSGGRVTFHPNDVPRVNGNLALSRSIGDKYLNPYVICEPELRQFKLQKDNKYIVLATDGLWDVLSNQEVKLIIDEVLAKKNNKRASLHDAIYKLLEAARSRHSQDNITILIWWL